MISVDISIFETQEIGCDLSLMKTSYNLTKRTTKTEKFENHFKMYIINFKTKGYELTPSVTSIIQPSITSLRDLAAIYGYLKNKNRQKQQL